MAYYWKLTAFVLIAVVLWLLLDKREKDLALLLNMAACSVLAGGSMVYLEPIVAWLWELCEIGNLSQDMLKTLFRAVGMGTVSEMTAMLCNDAGNNSLSTAVRLFGSCGILYISIPMMETLISLIQEMLRVL